MMWRLLASVLLMATTAQAGPITKLSSNGWWDVWYDASNRDGNPTCGWPPSTTGPIGCTAPSRMSRTHSNRRV
jgi:hypothetical protein